MYLFVHGANDDDVQVYSAEVQQDPRAGCHFPLALPLPPLVTCRAEGEQDFNELLSSFLSPPPTCLSLYSLSSSSRPFPSLAPNLSLHGVQTLLIGGKWRAFNFQGCSDRGLWCYLMPSSNCSVSSWRWEEISEKDFYMPQVKEQQHVQFSQ